MTKSYDPFARGPAPVGVRTLEVTDAGRARRLPVEVWYPAEAAHQGEDLDPARSDRYRIAPAFASTRQAAVRDAAPAPTGGRPLIVFSHGLGGHRRQSTFFTTHLASHGYVVIAPDHVGNTLPEMVALATGPPDEAMGEILQSAVDRPQDVAFLIEAFLEADAPIPERVEPERIGLAGHSFGAWTTVVATSGPSRVRCALPLAPIGTGNPASFTGLDAYQNVELDWTDRVPTLILAAEQDSICTLPGVEQLAAIMGAGADLVVLRNADHFHFCDRALETHAWFATILPSGGLTGTRDLQLTPLEACVAEAPAHDFVRGAGLAHFDRHLRARDGAAHFLGNGLATALARRGASIRDAASAPDSGS